MRLRRVLIPPQMDYGARDDLTPERVFNTLEFGRKAPPPSGFVTFKPCEAEKDIKFVWINLKTDNCIQRLKIAAMCGIFRNYLHISLHYLLAFNDCAYIYSGMSGSRLSP